MRHRAMEVHRHRFASTDRLFLDANIWFYLHGPQQPPAPSYVKTYSEAYKRILNAKSQIYIDVLVVSEFINRHARVQWKLFASHFKQFKEFRDSPFFKVYAQSISADAKLIVKHCSVIESGLSELNVNAVLDNYAAGSFDFNDQIISDLCKRKGLILMTHDGDFRDSGLSVLTANRNLLT